MNAHSPTTNAAASASRSSSDRDSDATTAEFLGVYRTLKPRDQSVVWCMLSLLHGKTEELDAYCADVVAEAREKVNASPVLRDRAEAYHLTVSQRVNTLFAAYVANEAEQDRLGRAGDDAGAQALCAPTIAIREQVFAIRDRTGCADLIAARLLLDLMLVTRWHDDGGPQIGFEDQETVLPLLETLADSTTGAVRQQAAKALATIGVEVAPEAADSMLELATAYMAANIALNDSDITDDKEVDEYCAAHIDPLRDRITEGAPTPTTMAGLIATLRLAERCIGQGDDEMSEPLVQAAVRFFEGRAA